MAKAPDNPDRGQNAAIIPMVVVGGLLVAGFFLMTMFGGSARDRALDASPIGIKAMGPWLQQADIPIRNSHPRLHPAVADLGLRILPLYDLDLRRKAPEPDTVEDMLNSGNLRDIPLDNFNAKIKEIQTVVMLPKWRGALVETGIAHEQSLIPLDDFDQILPQIGLRGIRLQRGGPEFTVEALPSGDDIALFHAQTFNRASLPKTCKIKVPFSTGALVIVCQPDEMPHPVYFVSDPDLMNNHGLAVADNAANVIAFLAGLRGDDERPVYIDRSPDLLTALERDDERQDYKRGAAEFERFFQYPFSIYWAALLITLAAVYWRGSKRFGPLQPDNRKSREISKRAAIDAKARLLRLSGNDGRMVADFVRVQLQELSHQSFGGDAGQKAEARFLKLLGRRNPDLAKDFGSVARSLMQDAPAMPPQQLHRLLASYHALLQKVMEHHGPI